ncbi:hypothetical protein MHU86_373 [Fragilaria crotonensis]|nr:hypothetical protein MHU86_373 [Fragilaria crotonensis]
MAPKSTTNVAHPMPPPKHQHRNSFRPYGFLEAQESRSQILSPRFAPELAAPPQLADPNSDHHLPNFHSNLKWDVIDLARYIRQINAFTEDEVPINTSYTLGTIQDDVDKVIRATADEHVKSLQNTLTMIAHALVRHTTRCQAPQYNLLSHHSKFERIRSDRSRETTVQSSKSHFGTLVGADNSADSRLKTMTSDENSDNGSATPQFCTDFSPIDPEIPDSPKTPTATSPTFYELYPSTALLFSGIRSRTNSRRQLNNPRFRFKFSTSSPIPDVVLEISDSVKRPVNGPNASLSYCAAVDTGNAATVVRTAASPNPQQWACRAHNPTVSSETLTYLDVQHPVPIKLEDLPSSQADDADVFLADHCYSCSNNDSTRETVNFYPDADPDPLPEVANDPDPEPMDIVEDDLDNNGDANRDIGEPNEVPSAAIQQLVRLLPPLRPAPPLRYANPLDAIHHHPFRMFQHFHHIPSRDLFFTEAMLMDTINGTIHLRDLPLCVRTSATISAFCINTLADPPELNIIRGLDKHFIHHILLHVIRNHMYIDELISGTNIPLLNVRPDKLLLLRSMKHTLNRATNMVVQHLNEQQRSQFLPRRTPEHSATSTTRSTTTPRLSDGNTMRSRHHLRAQITIHHASPQLFQPRPWTS